MRRNVIRYSSTQRIPAGATAPKVNATKNSRIGDFSCRLGKARRRPHEALAELQREPEAVWRLFGLALVYHELDRKKDADTALSEFIAKYSDDSAYQVAGAYAFRGETEKAFEWLEKAYARRDPGLSDAKVDPLLNNVRSDPRYAAFLKKMRRPL